MLAAIAPEFQLLNYIEAGTWYAIGGIVLALALARQRSGPARVDSVVWSVVLAFFGTSDIVEANTGAWWRPWWLLAWKAACLLVMLALIVRWARRRQTTRGGST